MANYYASARSNYFAVKDYDKFMAWVNTLPDVGVWKQELSSAQDLVDDAPPRFALYDNGFDACGWPTFRWSELEDEHGVPLDDQDFDILEELAPHLADGEVAVLMEVGAETLRYLTGYAIAVNSKGEKLGISLDDIYEIVRRAWGATPTKASW